MSRKALGLEGDYGKVIGPAQPAGGRDEAAGCRPALEPERDRACADALALQKQAAKPG